MLAVCVIAYLSVCHLSTFNFSTLAVNKRTISGVNSNRYPNRNRNPGALVEVHVSRQKNHHCHRICN